MTTIQVKRGSKADLPALQPGEFGLALDTAELYIGGESGNIPIAILGSTALMSSEILVTYNGGGN